MSTTDTITEQSQEPSEGIRGPVRAQGRWDHSANLDLLRTMAISFVLLDHWKILNKLLPFPQSYLGRAGVLCFFVHTCLVLMASLDRHEKTGKLRNLFVSFMTRRAFRVYPLSMLTVVLALVLVPSSQITYNGASHGLTVFSNLFLFQNLTRTPSIVGPMWSLPFEMQMYLTLPILHLMFFKRDWLPAIGLWILGAIFAALEYRFSPLPNILTFVPCFIGGLIAYCRATVPAKFSPWLLPASVAVLTLAFVFGARSDFQLVVFGWIFCLAIGILLPLFNEMRIPGVVKTCSLVATYSYGIYLFHELFRMIFTAKLPSINHSLYAPLSLICTIPASIVVYHFLERPMIRVGRDLSEKLCSSL